MKKAILSIFLFSIIITGCQKTPDKSSVVSKAGGLSKDTILEPLDDGEVRTTDIPQHWQMNEKKNADRMMIESDLNLGVIQIGNLPVKEMKNTRMDQGKLQELVSYFAKDEPLYMPQIYTKDVYQKNIDRIENKEGAYADLSLRAFYIEIEDAMKEAVEIAPETPSEEKKSEVKFQDKIEDSAWAIAQRREDKRENQFRQKYDKQIYFSADVGETRTGHIDAENYDSDLANSSSFSWSREGSIIDLEDIQSSELQNSSKKERRQDTTGYADVFGDLLGQYDARLDQEPFDKAEGQKQTEHILEDLHIEDMKLSSSEKVLWFPKDAMPERRAVGFLDDLLWQGDLGRAKVGYQYTYSRNIGGLSTAQKNGVVTEKTVDSYAPPFPVETITMLVTDQGIMSFSWKGMAEEVSIVAENTELMSFKQIEEQLIDQIFYWGSAMSAGQPASDPTVSTYTVTDAQLRYTYIPAYEKPANAWLIPAWFFEVRENFAGSDVQNLYFVISALDGGVIGTKN